MSENSPIKDALYENIEHIGEKQIHQLLLNSKFSELFEKICEPVIQKVKEIEEYEKYGILAESFTHYLFTEMLIPSQRKILFENIEDTNEDFTYHDENGQDNLEGIHLLLPLALCLICVA